MKYRENLWGLKPNKRFESWGLIFQQARRRLRSGQVVPPSACEHGHDGAVTPGDPLRPLIQRQALSTLLFDFLDQLGAPSIVLAALGPHPRISGTHLLAMRCDPTPRVEIS